MNKDSNIDEIFWEFFDCEANKTWDEKVDELLDAKISIDGQNDEGKSILHRAVEDDFSYLVELLLGHGANPNMEDNNGDTPLDYAYFRGDKEVISILMVKGAIKRDRQSAIERINESINEGQQHARAMQTLFSLIDKKADK